MSAPRSPETVVLTKNPLEQLHLSLQDRRGSTFLEIKTVEPPAAGNSGEAHTIRIGPTLWSAFLSAVQRLDQVIAGL